jgi:tetratricopeptide (TPR) repeat protein
MTAGMNVKRFQAMVLCALLALLGFQEDVSASDKNRQQIWQQLKKGYDAFKKRNFDLALSCADAALRLDTKQDAGATAKAHVLRSLVFNIRKKHDLAVAEATKAIQAKSDAPYAYFARARAYEWKEQYQKAADDLTKAIALTPKGGQQAVYYTISGEMLPGAGPRGQGSS